jgi:hypothetical protein
MIDAGNERPLSAMSGQAEQFDWRNTKSENTTRLDGSH